MLAKPLLKTAASLIAIAAFAATGCATPATSAAAPDSATSASAATPDAARAFVADAERDLAAMSEREARIGWVYSTYINYDTEWLAQWADSQGTQARVRLASEAARYADTPLDPETRRKIDLLRLALTLPAVRPSKWVPSGPSPPAIKRRNARLAASAREIVPAAASQ